MHNAALTAEQVAALYASGSAHGAPLPPEQADPGDPPPPVPSAYPGAVLADAPRFYWPLNELSQGTIFDATANLVNGTHRNGLTFGQQGALTNGTDTATLSPGVSGIGYTNTSVAAPTTFSLELFVKTTSATGGKLIGFDDVRTGNGLVYDRHLYMSNAGRISYGVNVGGVHQAIEAPIRYNDGLWHHVVATQGVGGMRIYVDGLLVASNAAVITPDVATGYWRVGGGLLTGWPNVPSSTVLNGTFDEVAVYPTELTAAQVFTHAAAAANYGGPPRSLWGARLTSLGAHLGGDGRDDVVEVSDHGVVSLGHHAGVGVRVDGDDALGTGGTDPMLDRPGNSAGEVHIGGNAATGLAHLIGVVAPTVVGHRSRAAHDAVEFCREILERSEALGAADAPPTADDDGGRRERLADNLRSTRSRTIVIEAESAMTGV